MIKPRVPIKNEAGFTLLEVIVAIAILGLALTGLAGALATGMRLSNTIEDQTVSATTATRYMEQTLAQPIEHGGCEGLELPDGYTVECTESSDSTYVTVTVVVFSGEDELLTVTTRKASLPR